MGKMGIIIYPNGNALFAASLGTNPGTFSKFGGNKCAQTLKNEYMKTSIYLRKTKDLSSLQKLLGHSNIRETMIYAHVMDESKREGMQCFNSFTL